MGARCGHFGKTAGPLPGAALKLNTINFELCPLNTPTRPLSCAFAAVCFVTASVFMMTACEIRTKDRRPDGFPLEQVCQPVCVYRDVCVCVCVCVCARARARATICNKKILVTMTCRTSTMPSNWARQPCPATKISDSHHGSLSQSLDVRSVKCVLPVWDASWVAGGPASEACKCLS